MEIVVAGAGIGGLAAALSLHAAGIPQVTVLEQAAPIRPLGVGLNILPNAVRELSELGVFDDVAARAVRTGELALFNHLGQLIWCEPRGEAAGYRWPQLSVHRGHLQAVLARAVRERLGAGAVRQGARVTGFTPAPGGRVRAQAQDASTGRTFEVEADVLVAADGVNSAVRARLYPDEDGPCSNGMVMWRGTAWAEPFLDGATMAVIGDTTQRIVFYPIATATATATDPDRVLINWVTGRPAGRGGRQRNDWQRTTDPDQVLRHFGGWRFGWLDIPAVVRATEIVYEYPMVDRDPLPRWTFGRVTLLGDAAHAMYPMGSNGATQAIVDGRALAYHLATSGDVDTALARYEADRRPRTTAVQLDNRRMGPEIVIDLANQRAPDGFDRIGDVFPPGELSAISARYAKTAGFDVETVNTSPSYTVT
jgi:2-polyprenyl-6-methoxyphenol hydroxylase-like FAD-dependent oxidoreductase